MKVSIKRQIAGAFIILMALTIFVCWFINTMFLEKYYVLKKQQTLMQAYLMLDQESADTSGTDYSEDFFSDFRNQYLIKNIDMLIIDPYSLSPSLEYVRDRDSEVLAQELSDNYKGGNENKITVIDSNDNYRVQKTKDIITNTDYLEIWGVLSNDTLFIMRTPLENIRESVSIANRFLMYVGLLAIAIAAIVTWRISDRITKPILELTHISSRMANLDFEVKYRSGGKNEVAILGHYINQLSQKLEQTISELKTANNELKHDIQKKEQIDEMRKDFLSNVSHELKTPIALIQGYAEGLKECINEDEESRDFYCEVIMDESDKMNKMVKKLLSLNTIEFGNEVVALERFDITEMIKSIIQSTQILAQQKGVNVIFHEDRPVYVWADEFKIEEVFTNFLSNAFNHVANEMIIEVKLVQRDGVVRVSVFNTGERIPEKELDNIWIKFYKVDKARTREYGGSGIGLSIVKAIMNSFNKECGVINYHNGVEFWFEIDSDSYRA